MITHDLWLMPYSFPFISSAIRNKQEKLQHVEWKSITNIWLKPRNIDCFSCLIFTRAENRPKCFSLWIHFSLCRISLPIAFIHFNIGENYIGAIWNVVGFRTICKESHCIWNRKTHTFFPGKAVQKNKVLKTNCLLNYKTHSGQKGAIFNYHHHFVERNKCSLLMGWWFFWLVLREKFNFSPLLISRAEILSSKLESIVCKYRQVKNQSW